MFYEEPIFRPPSEANSLILQAAPGCSWNRCTYCAMYRTKRFRVRPVKDVLADIEEAGREAGGIIHKVFVADGDALVMDMDHWIPLLQACRKAFPRLRQLSCYATAVNLIEKTPAELRRLRELGLELLYIGPESGDDVTLKRIAKGSGHETHVRAARLAREAGMKMSVIFLLGAGGRKRSREHAEASAALATAMDPRFVSLLTLTVIPGTPIAKLQEKGGFELPDVMGFLRELRVFIDKARPTDAIFRTNHASNYLPLSGRIPRDRERLIEALDAALTGKVTLRPEWLRGL